MKIFYYFRAKRSYIRFVRIKFSYISAEATIESEKKPLEIKVNMIYFLELPFIISSMISGGIFIIG
jgi:hypothetical protein